MDKIFEKKEQCYGCTACYNICPKKAITMEADKEGFLYPEIDTDKCIDCKMCVRVCPYHTAGGEQDYQQKYYAVQHKNKDVVGKSSSGGVFTALSDSILSMQGVVYGASFEEGFVIKHQPATNQIQRDKQRGSKYVQSSMDDMMQLIIADLNAGKKVMFTGSPCQVAGVSNFVQTKRGNLENLYLCDFICHGVASPLVWNGYVDYLMRIFEGKLERYNFRGKLEGWHNFYPEIVADNQNVSLKYKEKMSFFKLYATCYINRPSCYSCKFTDYGRWSDVTLADFWNVKAVAPQLDDNTGTSQVMINTRKGEDWFESCREDLICIECNKKDVWQPHLEYPNEVPAKREQFWKEYQEEAFEKILEKYGSGNFVSRCKQFATPIVKKLGLYVIAGKIYKLLFVKRGN